MQVVVLAGGVGSRLRPWTNSVPKPLLPMLDLSLLERVVEGVPEDLVDEVVVAGGYKVDMIQQYFAKADVDFDVRIVPEDKPLGTGGALGNCRDVVSGTFACFNGDIVSSLQINPLLDLHKKNGGIGTLALWEVEDPTRFGIVGLDEESRITQFKEKPTPEEVFSNLINAGSYILEDDIFDFMPNGKHSIERDVFPQLASQGALNGQQFEGYFIDAGTPSAWSDAVNRCIKERRFRRGLINGSSWYGSSETTTSDRVSESMIDSNVVVSNSTVHRSTLLSGAIVGQNSVVESCLVGRDVLIGSNVELRNMVIDHGSIIPDGTSMTDGQWPQTV
ncbi:MAG: NTP transferase domain-containing protein [Euryarchaeota archaeon]|jgi:mannose-1-phosphate guanylyltransferase|nr:NTP transferase domain-containing protein [Euryarchaeota archaeon]